ncbi:MOSC domain-containing protein [Rhodovibrionaceae bacterium A322]
MTVSVVAVQLSSHHVFSKQPVEEITLITGQGVAGDCHAGVTVKHRSRVAKDPSQPNLRQVHLIHQELLDEVAGKGFAVAPGDLGENVTLQGLDLLALPQGTRLRFAGSDAEVEITGLRNPCKQINAFQDGLLNELLGRADDGSLIRKGGVMSIVLAGGPIRPGMSVEVLLPAEPHKSLEPV